MWQSVIWPTQLRSACWHPQHASGQTPEMGRLPCVVRRVPTTALARHQWPRHRVGGGLVINPPALEIGPCIGRVMLDREVRHALPVDSVEEILAGEADSALRIGLVGHVDAHRPRDLVEADNPPRRQLRAGTCGADSRASARNSAVGSSTASREVTQDVSSRGERNRTNGGYAVWVSATSTAQRSHCLYTSGSVSRVDTPHPSA